MRAKRTSPAESHRAALRVALGLPECPPGTVLHDDDDDLVEADSVQLTLQRLDRQVQQLTATNAALVDAVQLLLGRMASQDQSAGANIDRHNGEPAAATRVARVLRATRPRATG